MTIDFERECFFIAPIGEKGSEIRKRSDGVRDWVVRPAAKAHGLETVRADEVGEPGQITSQAVQRCLKAKAAVADLTGGNPNVYYELSVRHGAQLPVVLIAAEGTKLPFDISQSRVIFFDHTDLASAGRAREELQEQIEASLRGTPDNPISDGMRLAELQGGNVEEQTLVLVMDRLQRLASVTESIDARLRSAERREATQAIVRDRIDTHELVEIREKLAWESARRAEREEVEAQEGALTFQEQVEMQAGAELKLQGIGESQAEPDNVDLTGVKVEHEAVGRNDPCWCGSGKKYKKCHGA